MALLALFACGRASAPEPLPRTSTAAARTPLWISIVVTDTSSGTRADENVAQILERAMSSIVGVTAIRAEIGDARVVVSLALDVDDDGAATEAVRDAIEQVRTQLPIGLDPPLVQRHGRDERDGWLLLRSDRVSAIGLAAVAERTIAGLVQQPGVREASLCGPRLRTVFEVDAQRLAAYGLGIPQLKALFEDGGGLASAIDPAAVMARVGASPELMALTMREDTTSSCSAIAAVDGAAVAVHVRYQGEHAGALSTHLANVRTALPPATELVHEPLDDRTAGLPPRVTIHAADADALARLPWREHPRAAGAWMIAHDDGSGEIVGLADAAAVTELASTLREQPGAVAVPEASPWSSVVLVGMDVARLEAHAPALAAALARVSPSGVWPEQAAAPARRRTSVDRERAATLGVDRSEIDDALAASSPDGLWLGRRSGDDARDVVLRIAGDAARPLPDLQVKAAGGRVPLSSLVTVTVEPVTTRSRCNTQRCIGFALPSELANGLDLPALGRELGLAPDEYLAVLPRAPQR